MEIERREIEPTMDYYTAVREPITAIRAVADIDITTVTTKREHWRCISRPVTDKDPAIFLLIGIDYPPPQ